MKSFNAIRDTGQTLVGSFGDFPRKFGNCFSVEDEDGKNYRILNFKIENIKELVRRGELSWPIKCEALGEHSAVINDGRIPDDWYMDHFCETCTPLDLLPLPQRLQQLRDIQRGNREEFDNGIVKIKIDPVVHQKKEIKWTVVEAEKVSSTYGLGLDEELSKIISNETLRIFTPASFKGATEWKEGMPNEWKPMFEGDGGYFYAPNIPLKKED